MKDYFCFWFIFFFCFFKIFIVVIMVIVNKLYIYNMYYDDVIISIVDGGGGN